MLKIILARHGESTANKRMQYAGHWDCPLTEEGKRQAQKLALELEKEDIDAIYSSDMKRALDTACCIVQGRPLEIIKEPLLRELHFGAWEGLIYEEIGQGWGKLRDKWLSNPIEFAPPKGETLLQLKERALEAFFRITSNHKKGTIILVSHAGPIKCILCHINKLPLSSFWDIDVPPGSIKCCYFK
jgi:alpha-ribazole phosphatase